jgi:hypothetical protein
VNVNNLVNHVEKYAIQLLSKITGCKAKIVALGLAVYLKGDRNTENYPKGL